MNLTTPIIKPYLDCKRASSWPAYQALIFIMPIGVIIFMQVYSRLKRGKFTAQPPFMFLQDNDRNRLLTIVTFGFLSQQIMAIMFTSTASNICKNVGGPEKYICTFFVTIFISTISSLVSYPIFLCISSTHLLVASIVGIVFTTWEFISTGLSFYAQCECKNVNQLKAILKQQALDKCKDDEKAITDIYIAILLPSFVCLTIILFGFGKRLYVCIKYKCSELPEREMSVVAAHQILHLEKLMKMRYLKPTRSILYRLKTVFKPWYRFPSEIWQCIIVIVFILYTCIAVVQQLIQASLVVNSGDSPLVSILKGAMKADTNDLWYSTLVLSILLYALVVIHFLYCVQKDAFSIYKGTHALYERDDGMHNRSLYYHMVFPAYLISSMVIGFLTCFIVVLIVVFVFYVIVHVPILIWKVIRILLSLLAFNIAFTWIQRFSIRYYLADLEISRLQINIKHPRLFFVLKFFLLFANIISSISSLLKRLVFIMLNFFLFYGRMDRNPLMFFKNWDISRTYAAFLRVENVFKNPSMRCFCQMLLEPHIVHASDLTTQEKTRDCWGIPLNREKAELSFSNLSKTRRNMVARNRWFLAYTLINNPGLTKVRRSTKDFNKNNSDDQMMVKKI